MKKILGLILIGLFSLSLGEVKASKLPSEVKVTVVKDSEDLYEIPNPGNRLFYVFYKKDTDWVERSRVDEKLNPKTARILILDIKGKGIEYSVYEYSKSSSNKALARKILVSKKEDGITEEDARKIVTYAGSRKVANIAPLLLFLIVGGLMLTNSTKIDLGRASWVEDQSKKAQGKNT